MRVLRRRDADHGHALNERAVGVAGREAHRAELLLEIRDGSVLAPAAWRAALELVGREHLDVLQQRVAVDCGQLAGGRYDGRCERDRPKDRCEASHGANDMKDDGWSGEIVPYRDFTPPPNAPGRGRDGQRGRTRTGHQRHSGRRSEHDAETEPELSLVDPFATEICTLR